MATALRLLAFDLGAESGRAVSGHFDGERLRLSEEHRFPNGPVRIFNSLHWDVLRLFSEVKQGLALSVGRYRGELASLGVDTWGVDFGLLGRDGILLGNPYHYRDRRTDGMMDDAFRRVGREEIFTRTGIQFLELNTLYQLLAMVVQDSPLLSVAHTLLLMPDLFNYWLTGQTVSEFTIATTTQFYDPRAGDWSRELLKGLGVPTGFLTPVIQPGTVLGPLLPSVAEEVGVPPLTVVATAGHDTGAAVAAVPMAGPDCAYISSGTWSVLGAEATEPVITAESLAHNFTNEGGVGGVFRLSKNIIGLWPVQECRRAWARQGDELSYADLTALAARARPFGPLLDPGHRRFLNPTDMPAEIRTFCKETSQELPADKGAMVRCALETLALAYREGLGQLEELVGRRLGVVHIVGGGSRNELLCQLSANAMGRPVLAGPAEATSVGNMLVQALALGHLSSLAEARELVRRSFDVKTYEPQPGGGWDEAFDRFLRLRRRD